VSREEAIALYDSGFWKEMDYKERAKFQLFEKLLCMPFGVFHEAVEKALGRPVYTHEFGSGNINNLQRELLGEAPAPTLEEIVSLIPKDKQLLIAVTNEDWERHKDDCPLPDAKEEGKNVPR
jgi:hypothetical protein